MVGNSSSSNSNSSGGGGGGGSSNNKNNNDVFLNLNPCPKNASKITNAYIHANMAIYIHTYVDMYVFV